MKLKHFLREKGYIVNHAVKIVKSIVECFYKCYGNTISEMSEAAVNVHVDEGDCLLLDVSRIVNCNVWSDLTEIAQYSIQLAAFQELFDHFKEMTIFSGVTFRDIKESFQATIQYALTYCSTNIANPIDFWSKVLTLKKDDQLMKPSLLIVEICLCAMFSNATLERLFSQMNLVKTMVRNRLSNDSLNSSLRIRISGITLQDFHKTC